jgi:hypothetical protein
MINEAEVNLFDMHLRGVFFRGVLGYKIRSIFGTSRTICDDLYASSIYTLHLVTSFQI